MVASVMLKRELRERIGDAERGLDPGHDRQEEMDGERPDQRDAPAERHAPKPHAPDR